MLSRKVVMQLQKKIVPLILFVCLGISSLIGCGRKGQEQNEQKAGQEKKQPDMDTIEKDTVGNDMEATEQKGTSPAVYMTTDISSEGLLKIYKALNATPEGNIAVKLSTGEPGSNYLRTDLIGDLMQSLHATIVECNTAYGGNRANTAMHYQVAEDHGYTKIADVDIMDENGSMTLPVAGGKNLEENYVGPILPIMIIMSYCHILRDIAWQDMEVRSKIFL